MWRFIGRNACEGKGNWDRDIIPAVGLTPVKNREGRIGSEAEAQTTVQF